MVWRTLFLVFALFAIVSVTTATNSETASIKDDYKALLKTESWIGREYTAVLQFRDKEFPKLEITFTESVEGKDKSFKVSGTLEEKDGKRVLVIDGKSIGYKFEKDGSFLVLDGEFEHEKKVIKLTGKWGKVMTKKG